MVYQTSFTMCHYHCAHYVGHYSLTDPRGMKRCTVILMRSEPTTYQLQVQHCRKWTITATDWYGTQI